MRQGFDRIGRQIGADRAQAGCFDKKRFDSRNKARDFAKRGEKVHGNQPSEPYKCHICGAWHLTTQSKPGRVKSRARDWFPAQLPRARV